MSDRWIEKDSYSAENSAVAASGSEVISATSAKYNVFNRLLVQNGDVVDIEIRLDQLDLSGRVFRVPKNNGYLVLEPNSGIYFKTVQAVNLDGATAETAGKILYRFAYAEEVD